MDLDVFLTTFCCEKYFTINYVCAIIYIEGINMKKLYTYVCFVLLIFTSFFVIGCEKPKENEDILNVSYENLKSVATSETPNSWDKISATRKDSNGEEKIIINKIESQITPVREIAFLNSNNINWNFIVENNHEKIYCKDNVRYHQDKNRSYIDDSEFDGQQFLESKINEYLNEMNEFFNGNNSKGLKSSNKKENNNITTYEFKAVIEPNHNTILKAIFTLRNNYLININVEIESDVKSREVLVELKESDEIVATPEWFDNDDYKTSMTYEEVKEIVSDQTLFDDWDSAELFLPVGYSSDIEDKRIFTSKSQNKTYLETKSTKKYFDGVNLFTYREDGAESKQALNNEEKKDYMYSDIIQEYRTYTYFYFFEFEFEYYEYYEAAKKYEKDITVVSYKFAGIWDNVKFDAVCLLYFDLEENLYQVSCYAKQYDITDVNNEILMFEISDLTLKKTNSFEIPTWFDESDFE